MELRKPPCSSDFRRGADKLHSIFDGRIHLPDKLCVLLAGTLGAAIPIGLLLLWYRGTL